MHCAICRHNSAHVFPVVMLTDAHGGHTRGAHRIVLENSGVAEPQNIRDKMGEAEAEGHPVMDRIFLDTMVTVVGTWRHVHCGSYV